ncbi:MAG TPA: AAA family ATPase [Candidatus Paceibacterota bacterium]|nr:AAA family ATPase [Verrucomicrobiota bacterium]HRY50257.1 AAA family ATPase [Candidatus Paceibacterota bacterium]
MKAVRHFPALVLTGPRRAGKTMLLRRLFPRASYFLLEDPDVVARLRADPQGFLDAVKTPAILDEVQQVPEVFAHIRARIDRQPRCAGRWLLTGSQDAPLMRGVSESMSGFPPAGTRRLAGAGGMQGRTHGHTGDGRADAAAG